MYIHTVILPRSFTAFFIHTTQAGSATRDHDYKIPSGPDKGGPGVVAPAGGSREGHPGDEGPHERPPQGPPLVAGKEMKRGVRAR